MTQNPLPPLIDLAYAAMDDAARWRDFLAAFAAALDAAQSTLSIQYTNHPEISITAYGGPKGTDEVHREYLAKWAASDPWVSSKEMRSVGEGKIICSQQLCPDEILEQTDVYREFMQPHGFHYGGGVIVALGPRQIAVHGVTRPKHLGILRPEELELWQALLPHLTRVVKTQGRLHELAAERETYGACFEQHQTAMLLANQRGFVLQSNHRARRALAQQDGLLLDENGHLVAADPHLAGELAELLRLTGHPGPVAPAPAAQLLIPRRDLRRPLLVSVSPLARPQAVSPGANFPTVTVQLLDPDPNTLPRPEVLQQLFDLTKSEAEVCCRLAAGLTVEETAAALFVSLNTVRTHLKRVLSKTNTRRQPELTALLNQIAAQQLVE